MLRGQKYIFLICTLISLVCFTNVAWIEGKALVAQILIKQAWTETLETGKPVTPWSWADFWPVARLYVRKSGKELYVLSNASGASLAFGPGHVNGSALPASEGASIIAGHRDTHFEFLKDIGVGDVIFVQAEDGQSRTFRVSGFQVSDIRQTKLSIDSGQTELTLVTCYPLDAIMPGGPKRLLVQLLPEGEFDAG